MKLIRHVVLIVTFLPLAFSCKGAVDCPPDTLIQEMHAAAFHFQHGTVEQGRQHLEQARERAGNRGEGQTREVLAKLSSISQRIVAEPERAQLETEYLRAFFSDWTCLPEQLHKRLHEALPAIQ